MSRPDVKPGATETQQMRVTAPVGVSIGSVPPPTRPRNMSHKTNELTFFFPLPRCRPTSGYVYEYHTRWVDDPSRTRWTFPAFLQVSWDRVVFGSQLPTSFCSISLSWCRNPTVVHRPLAKKQPHDPWGHTMHVYVQPTQHPDQSQQIHVIFREDFSFPNDDRSISSSGEL